MTLNELNPIARNTANSHAFSLTFEVNDNNMTKKHNTNVSNETTMKNT